MKLNKELRFVLVTALILVLIMSAGCIRAKDKGGDNGDDGTDGDDGNGDSNGNGDDGDDGSEPSCGNGVVDTGESCITCPADVVCGQYQICTKGVCKDRDLTVDEEITECNKKDNQLQIELCLKSVAERENLIDICEMITVLDKENCYYNVAVGLEDLTICNKITDLNTHENCLIKISELTDDPAICNTVSKEEKTGCLERIANSTEDLEICKMIKTTRNKDLCIKNIVEKKDDPELCSLISSTYIGAYLRDNCYIELSDDLKYCLKLTEKSRQGECIAAADESTLAAGDCNKFSSDFNQDCYTKEAELKEDYKYCLLLEDNLRLQDCLDAVVNSDYLTADVCPHLDEVDERDNCYYTLAIAEINLETCMKVSGRKLRKTCILEIAEAEGDEEICERFTKEFSYRDECYITIAVDKISTELCNKAFFRSNYASCHGEIAYLVSQPDICDGVERGPFSYVQEAINYCYYYYSEFSETTDYCGSIKNLTLRIKCEALDDDE